MSHNPQITAVVLAGGQGRRMAGADKGLVHFQDRPLIEHALSALQPQVSSLLISANRNLDQYQSYGYGVISDADGAYCGPLAGVLAALQRMQTEYLVTVPCDAPFVTPDFVARLDAARHQHGATAAVCHDGRRLQPVFSLLSRSVAQPLREYLAAGERRARNFLLAQRAVSVDFSDQPALFVNLNRPEDLHWEPGARAVQ